MINELISWQAFYDMKINQEARERMSARELIMAFNEDERKRTFSLIYFTKYCPHEEWREHAVKINYRDMGFKITGKVDETSGVTDVISYDPKLPDWLEIEWNWDEEYGYFCGYTVSIKRRR